jgi:hypothetical protein
VASARPIQVAFPGHAFRASDTDQTAFAAPPVLPEDLSPTRQRGLLSGNPDPCWRIGLRSAHKSQRTPFCRDSPFPSRENVPISVSGSRRFCALIKAASAWRRLTSPAHGRFGIIEAATIAELPDIHH